jgi:hypothetical protein
VPPNPTTTHLAAGRYLALTDAGLAALRKAKGDRARREHVAGITANALDVGDAWPFFKHLAGVDVFLGTRLHRGQMHRIELLDLSKLEAALDTLAARDLREAFFGLDEAAFRHSSVPFWVADRWKEEGRTTVLDDHVFRRVSSAFAMLQRFVIDARANSWHVVFTTSY